MKKLSYILLPILALLLLTACGKPDHHPKNYKAALTYGLKKVPIILIVQGTLIICTEVWGSISLELPDIRPK